MDKNAIKKFAVWARRELIERVSQKAMQYGIEKDTIVDATADSINGKLLTDTQKKQRKTLISQIKTKGYEEVMEEVAYTWFNRLIALRFMEVNGYLPTHVRVFTDEENNFKPQIIDEALHLDLDGLNIDKVYEFKNANQTEELYKYLLITQCNALNSVLPKIFQHISDYTELLLPDNLLHEGSVIEQMISIIPEEDWQDAVQIIGWLYQYYISEKHDEIVNIYKGTVKQEDVPAATQLFTTDWVVRYMVDNSLGRYWIERHPESNLAEKLDFLVKPKNGKIQIVNETISPQNLTFFDPCMGSGHILAYAFDVLIEIYREYGYTDREAVAEIIQNNLYGFDIDERCTQLAYFVVMMKARQYDTRFFKRRLHPQVYYPKANSDLKAYGSLLKVDTLEVKPEETEDITLFDMDYDIKLNDWNCRRLLFQKYAVVCTNPPYLNKYNNDLKKFVTENYKDYSGDLFSVFIYRNFGFCQKKGYSAFMTPFVWMFIKTYEKLRKYVINNKSITSLIQMEYSAFEEATVPICSFILQNCKSNNQSLCLRLSDFKGGMEVQKTKVLEALQNPDCGYFYEAQQANFSKIPGSPVAYWASITACSAFVNGKPFPGETKKGVLTGDNERFLRLWHEVSYYKTGYTIKSHEDMISSRLKWFPVTSGGYMRKWYGNYDTIVNLENDGLDIRTTVKNYRLRECTYYFREALTWTEVSSGIFSCRYVPEGILFGNGGPVSFFFNNHLKYILGLLNSKVTMSIMAYLAPTINYGPEQIKKLPILFYDQEKVNLLVTENISLSKMDWDSFETSWNFIQHPLIRLKNSMKFMVTDNNSKSASYFLQDVYHVWINECEERFAKLKANEEELNRIFITIYGLQEELTPEIEDKNVTVYRIFDNKEDIPENMGNSKYALTKQDVIKSLISYAVGCMFGRYSLDIDGLAYAGGEWNKVYRHNPSILDPEKEDGSTITLAEDVVIDKNGQYHLCTFAPDKDNIIPICNDEYFNDDVVGLFVKFIEVVYGKDTLEENLKFIADALGGKGQPKEVIRNYFLNNFYKDHCKTYQKRPIYWLFDSGKKNGFKALIYMHRYQPDTIARIRTDYVHEQQSRYHTAIADMENRIVAATSTSERIKLNKALIKLKDQDTELKNYEEKIHHLADQMIGIDLDDGVKVNYAKFQDVLAKIK